MSNPKSSVGRALMRKRAPNQRRTTGDTWVNQRTDLTASSDWNRMNLRSVTDQSSLEEFLTTAQLADTDFTAERLNVTFVPAIAKVGILTKDEKERILRVQDNYKERLRIPRRPTWNSEMTAEQIDQQERATFLDWRRKLALMQEIDDLTMTPFEKNLEFWRQLWRVLEKSDVVVQIVDARNPLLFRCEDLEQYVAELSTDLNKVNVILVNKADLLTDKQRTAWASFFDQKKIYVFFYSALNSAPSTKKAKSSSKEKYDSDSIDDTEKVLEALKKTQSAHPEDNLEISSPSKQLNRFDALKLEEENDEQTQTSKLNEDQIEPNDGDNDDDDDHENYSENDQQESEDEDDDETETIRDEILDYVNQPETEKKNLSVIVNREELIFLLKSSYKEKTTAKENLLTIGMVGYPNVGKSSTINSLLQYKKVSVSSTPGKTKHFQTLFLEKNLLLCDCPGLVFPSFVSTKDELTINGILPIDQMRDYIGPINLVCHQIPRSVLSQVYSICLPIPREGEDENRPPTALELCAAYANLRGFMTHKGIPDGSRAARLILKDYVNGKLLYCYPPPGCDSVEFQEYDEQFQLDSDSDDSDEDDDDDDDDDPDDTNQEKKRVKDKSSKKKNRPKMSDVDQQFFEPSEVRVGSKGIHGQVNFTRRNGPVLVGQQSSEVSADGKPWKKHNNKNKKEKLRRLYRHLDA